MRLFVLGLRAAFVLSALVSVSACPQDDAADDELSVASDEGDGSEALGFATSAPPSGDYHIVSRRSGKALDVYGSSAADGAAVMQYGLHGRTNQQFHLEALGNGEYSITARHSGKRLEVAGRSLADGAAVQQWASTGGANQRWRIRPAGRGYYTLVVVHSGKVLDVQGNATTDGARLTQYRDLGLPNQQFELLRVGAGVRAEAADAFVDSIGVNTHFTYPQYRENWDRGANLRQKLRDLGVRHVRDGIAANDTFQRAALRELCQGLGIRLLLVIGKGAGQTPADAYPWVRDHIGFGCVAAVEGLNEQDSPGGTAWIAPTRQAQADLWRRFRGSPDPAARAIAVLAPSVTSPEAATALGDLSAASDHGNVHVYFAAGRPPETTGWGGVIGDYAYGDVRYTMQSLGERNAGRGRPIVASESGHHTLETQSGVPEDVQAVYAPRLFLHDFRLTLPSGASLRRVYLYELFDESAAKDYEAHFGWVRSDGSVKPAFVAMKNLIALLADRGPAFQPGRLDFRLEGQTDGLHRVLLQKRDGTFYLALWLDRPIWDGAQRRRVAVPAQRVTLRLRSPMSGVAQVAPNEGTTWRELAVGDGVITLDVGPRVLLVRLTR
jgi:hypothetical protein